MNIRLATENDLVALCAIRNHLSLFKHYFHLQRAYEAKFVVAEVGGVVVGFGLLKLTGELKPKLSDLYVTPTFRENGIGSALIQYREKLAKLARFKTIYVSVDPINNPKMIQLITNLGYKPICEPYKKTAIFYDATGQPYEQTYMRVDFKKSLFN